MRLRINKSAITTEDKLTNYWCKRTSNKYSSMNTVGLLSQYCNQNYRFVSIVCNKANVIVGTRQTIRDKFTEV
jgi:hypothetical protein